MRRAFDVVGTQVMDGQSGKIVGVVHDLVFDREGRLQGILLEKQSWFGSFPFLPSTVIQSIGEDVVMVSGQPADGRKYSFPEWVQWSKGQRRMAGQPVITSNGKQLGVLEDVYFQENKGNIIGYEVSDGFFADVMEGRYMIEQPDKLLFGEDAFVIQKASPEIVPDTVHGYVSHEDSGTNHGQNRP